jgi:hypothetical protein
MGVHLPGHEEKGNIAELGIQRVNEAVLTKFNQKLKTSLNLLV